LLLLLSLAVPLIVATTVWLIQWYARLPRGSPSAALTAVIFLAASLIEILAVPVAIATLVRRPELRTVTNVSLTALCALLLPAAALLVISIFRSSSTTTTNAGGQSGELMFELAGDPPVSVRSIKVLAGTPQAMPPADALAGLKEALPYLQQAAKQSEVEGKTLSGSFVVAFVTEPDGMIRIMMEGEVRLTGGDPKGVVKGLVGSTMSDKWRFPTSGGQSIIEAEFVVGEPCQAPASWPSTAPPER
jgi:hypothetical protein